MRKEMIGIVASGAIHFTNPPLLQGSNFNLWFPLSTRGNSINHAEIEALLLLNKVAHNVVRIEKVRESGNAVEYNIIYNEYTPEQSDELLRNLLNERNQVQG